MWGHPSPGRAALLGPDRSRHLLGTTTRSAAATIRRMSAGPSPCAGVRTSQSTRSRSSCLASRATARPLPGASRATVSSLGVDAAAHRLATSGRECHGISARAAWAPMGQTAIGPLPVARCQRAATDRETATGRPTTPRATAARRGDRSRRATSPPWMTVTRGTLGCNASAVGHQWQTQRCTSTSRTSTSRTSTSRTAAASDARAATAETRSCCRRGGRAPPHRARVRCTTSPLIKRSSSHSGATTQAFCCRPCAGGCITPARSATK